jgi:hypothetical protein
MFTEANPITLPSDPGFGRAPQLSIPPAAARNLILGLSVAFAVSLIAIGQFVVSRSPASIRSVASVSAIGAGVCL